MNEPMSAEQRGKLGAQKRWGTKDADASETPKYRITKICHHNDRIYDPELQPLDGDGNPKPLYMDFTGPPAYYMEPANASAEAMAEKYPPAPFSDPINSMTMVISPQQAIADALKVLATAAV